MAAKKFTHRCTLTKYFDSIGGSLLGIEFACSNDFCIGIIRLVQNKSMNITKSIASRFARDANSDAMKPAEVTVFKIPNIKNLV
ncbi:hypothetical protein CWO84_09885 [Methylomonas sp. Kb3]|nr:hypothetical protein CWO84_09885 [Methylomonas sp. Kb3]